MYNLDNGLELTMKYEVFSIEDENKFGKKEFIIKNMLDYGDTLVSASGHACRYSHDDENRRGEFIRRKQIDKQESWDESMKIQKIPKAISKEFR